MDDILKLAKDYSKKRHLDLLPHGNNNILENLDFIYDENWENQGVPYPYEILTYLFDSYYVLPERPDLAALFCWQAINHSYYVQQLSDNNVGFCQDTKGVELVRDAILGDWNNKYKTVLEPFLKRMPDKTFHYVASYMLKGYAMEKKGIAEKYRATSYKSLKRKISSLRYRIFWIMLMESHTVRFPIRHLSVMNSINANKDTFKMYTDMFLAEYIILAIHLNSQGALSDVVLNKVKKNANLMV